MATWSTVPNAILAILFGGIGVIAFEPFAFWPALLLSISGFIWTLKRSNRPWLIGFLYGSAFFLPLLKWSGAYVGALPWLALSALQALFFIPFAVLAYKVKSPWQIAALWVAMEALRSRLPWGGFGWGRVAFSQIDAPTVSVVSLGGAALLSFITVALASGLAMRKPQVLATLLLIPIASIAIPSSSSRSIDVAAVQGNVPQLGLDFNAQREAVLNNHLQATSRIAPGSVDLILWPENASDVDPYSVKDRIQTVVDAVKTPVLVGGIPRIGGRIYNASILWLPESGPTTVYFKRELAPFGEYMPLRSIAEAIVPEAKRVEDFAAGSGLILHHVQGVSVSSIICFEILNDGLVREGANNGAQLLVVQTNSATFGRTAESEQQLAITRLRAIEFARSIVSVSTSGVSALISPSGEVLKKSGIFEQKVLTDSLEINTERTISAQIGGWAEVALIFLPFFGVVRRK